MADFDKRDVQAMLSIEQALLDAFGEMDQSPDPNWPGNPPAGLYQHTQARVNALQILLDQTPNTPRVLDGGEF